MSDFSVPELLLLQLFLIILNAVFACAEIAVISINETKLKRMSEDGDRRAKRLLSLTQQPAKFLATIQVGITLAGFLGSAFAADSFSDRIVDWLIAQGVTISPVKLDVLSVIGITLILSYITLIVGELVPKRIAMQKAEKIGLAMSGLIYIIAKIFAPLVWLLTVSTNIFLRLIGINPEGREEKVTEEEIRIMIDAGSEDGAIDDVERSILHNVFEFDDKWTEEVMTHRTEVVSLDANASLEKWEKIMIQTRYSVYPLYQESPDNIVGTLSIKDYFKFKKDGKAAVMQNAVKPAQFISGSAPIDELFKNMQKSRQHFAIVVDEYGGLDGIVTMNDLLEEIVGDLEDDLLAPPTLPLIHEVRPNFWRIKGETPISDVTQKLKIAIPSGEYDTFAGFLLSLMGSIPSGRQNIKLTYNNLKIKILKIGRRKIEDTLVQVTATKKEA